MDIVKPRKIDHKSLSRLVITNLRAILSLRQQLMESTMITVSMELRWLRSMTLRSAAGWKCSFRPLSHLAMQLKHSHIHS